MGSWAQCLRGCIFSCSEEIAYSFFNFLFDILEKYKLGLCITVWKQRFGFWLYFYLSKRVSLCSTYGFFFANLQLFYPIWGYREQFYQINFKYFNGNCDCSSCPGSWILFLYVPPHKGLAFWKNSLWTSLSFSYSLKITCILLRQVISLKNMVELSAKFTILISWSPICIPLILLSALMRLASTSAAVLYNNLDSWHHWRTHIGVKGSNRRPFILILDSILVYAT